MYSPSPLWGEGWDEGSLKRAKRSCAGALFTGLFLCSLLWAAEWKVAEPEYQWSFPQDHWAHPEYRTEWWYFTGHLESRPPGRRFGYQFTFFRIGLVEEPPTFESNWATGGLIMGHAAITDIESGLHHFSELLYRQTALLGEFKSYPDSPIAWARGPVGTSEKWSLRWNGQGFDFSMRDDEREMGLDLTTLPEKPLVLQGPNGYSQKADSGAASLYYSFTRLTTQGTLHLGEHRWAVEGESWMDKELSTSQLGRNQVGWDWFSLQLLEGWDLMFFLMRRENGQTDYRSATLVSPDGSSHYLEPGEWEATVTESWTSPESKATYPSRWTVAIPDQKLRLDVIPLLKDQENRSRLPGGVYYWEGAVTARDPAGKPVGRGYVELTGYGEGNRPPI